jgi:membrane-associated phospholipid phosphatase
MVVISYYWIDRQLALYTEQWYSQTFSHYAQILLPAQPDRLSVWFGFFFIVGAIGVIWKRWNKTYVLVDILIVFSAAMIVSMLAKMGLKFIFSRFSEQAFLLNHSLYGFVWFHDYQSFPSGHMTILLAGLTVFWLYLPKLRFLVFLVAMVESILLILNFDHFLSDIMAGVYVGIIITLILQRIYNWVNL